MDETAIEKLDKPVDKIDVEKALKMRLKNGLTFQEIADHFGVSRQAIHQRLSRFIDILGDADTIKAYEEHKPSLLSAVENKLLQQLIDGDKLEKASLNNAAYAFNTIYQCNRLERGKSTENVSIKSITEHYSKELDRAKDLLKTLEES